MQGQIHPSSAGSIIKKIVEINPKLGVSQVLEIIKQAIEPASDDINDRKAMQLAEATLKH